MTKPQNSSTLDGKTFLVGLGAQKAGSTWLARYFGLHPKIYVPRLKELHYFDVVYAPELRGYANDRMIRLAKEISDTLMTEAGRPHPKKLEKLIAVIDRLQMTADKSYHYLRFFEDRVTDEDVFCDITPAYALLDAKGFEAINRTHSKVKYIFLLRDPVDRFWSAIRMGMRKMENFNPSERFMGLLDHPEHYGRCDYGRTITELEKVVSPDAIQYVFYEDLFTQTSARILTDFIGVEPMDAPFDNIVNPGARIDMTDAQLAAARDKFRHVYDFVFARFGSQAPQTWHDRIEGRR